MQQHFEGYSPPKSIRWILLSAAIAIVLLFVVFARATLPGQRSEFVGRWMDIKKPYLYYNLQGDGDFRALIPNDLLPGHPNVNIWITGTWKASADALYLTYEKIERNGKLAEPKAFDKEAKRQIGRTFKLPIERVGKDLIRIGGNTQLTFTKSLKASPPPAPGSATP